MNPSKPNKSTVCSPLAVALELPVVIVDYRIFLPSPRQHGLPSSYSPMLTWELEAGREDLLISKMAVGQLALAAPVLGSHWQWMRVGLSTRTPPDVLSLLQL